VWFAVWPLAKNAMKLECHDNYIFSLSWLGSF
jgi:hypothetical protein